MRTIDRLPIRTTIDHVGQPYVDHEIVKPLLPDPVQAAVAIAFGRVIPVRQLLVAYEHERLNWQRPNGRQRS